MTDEQIIAELDLSEGVPDLQQRIVGNVRHVVEQRVIGLVTEMIQGEQEQEFERLVDSGDNTAVWTWLREKVVGVDISEVYEATLKEYLEEFKARQITS